MASQVNNSSNKLLRDKALEFVGSASAESSSSSTGGLQIFGLLSSSSGASSSRQSSNRDEALQVDLAGSDVADFAQPGYGQKSAYKQAPPPPPIVQISYQAEQPYAPAPQTPKPRPVYVFKTTTETYEDDDEDDEPDSPVSTAFNQVEMRSKTLAMCVRQSLEDGQNFVEKK